MTPERKYRYFALDFETTIYKGQTYTEVWASACAELYTESVNVFHSIEEQYKYLVSLNQNIIGYYHNLKFDGMFWLSYLLLKQGYRQAITKDSVWIEDNKMPNKSLKYMISSMGQWYSLTLKINNRIIQFRDSLKLLPFTLQTIGKSFDTKHQKTSIEYTGFRYAGCDISEQEEEYIKNDVLVLKEALEFMIDEKHNKLTIGSCCLEEFKSTIPRYNEPYWYDEFYPDLTKTELDPNYFGAGNADEYIRKSYKGGWCYLAKGKEHKEYSNGVTVDVNSLYPSVMHSESKNKYPVGSPKWWVGDYIPDEAKDKYYFLRIKTRFYLKPNRVPCIQIKKSFFYKGNEWLENSDITDIKTGEKYTHIREKDGTLTDTSVILTLTMTDYKLIKEQYDLVDCQILDGCWFECRIGLFDEYINKYKEIKEKSKGARRTLAKLFLNNLYGKLASSTDSTFKVAYILDNVVKFKTIKENNKKAGYIAIGSAITSYARNFTIRAAQANYNHFIYADTDSLHLNCKKEDLKDISLHDTHFLCWKVENEWDTGYFLRQKTYIEKTGDTYDIKCAGMPEKCKRLFEHSIKQDITDFTGYNEEETKFIKQKRTVKDLTVGLSIPSKLTPKSIQGGVVLQDTTFTVIM